VAACQFRIDRAGLIFHSAEHAQRQHQHHDCDDRAPRADMSS
jgi:hypothetical protein